MYEYAEPYRLANYPKLYPTIPIPVNEDGTYDLEKQKELSTKYEQIEIIKNDLFNKLIELTNIIAT